MREAASFIASQTGRQAKGSLMGLVDSVGRLYRAWTSRRKLTRLSEFDDHVLRDIGLSREDVRHALGLPFTEDASCELQKRALRNRSRGWRERS